jgi:signal transduction histidine kinase
MSRSRVSRLARFDVAPRSWQRVQSGVMYETAKRQILLFNVLLASVLFTTAAVAPLVTGSFPPGRSGKVGYWGTLVCLGVLVLLCVWNLYIRNRPEVDENISPSVMATLATGVLTYLGYLPPIGIVTAYYLIITGIVASDAPRIPYLLLPLLTIAQVVLVALRGDSHAATLYAVAGIVAVVGLRYGRYARRSWKALHDAYRRSLSTSSEITNANLRLREEVMKAEVFSRIKERSRVGREVHDTVGYTLTAVLMQINACQDELRNGSRDIAKRLSGLEELVRNAIVDVRKEVHSLREEARYPESWRTRWLELCRVFDDSTRVRIHANIEEEFANLDSETGEAVSRVLQEALTNSLRHGDAYMIDVAIGLRDGLLLIRISDNGSGTERVITGNGLRGIRERINALGGTLELSSEPGRGFDVGIELPYRTEVARTF